VPSERRIDSPAKTNPDTLIVMVGNDSTLRLNDEVEMGETDDPAKLIARLKDVFNQRIVSEAFADGPSRPTADRIERTVFIKAPRSLDYGSVARVVDAVKLAGAYPISLQIDDLD